MARRDWLSRFWNACHPPTRRSRGSARCGVAGEVLELRQYLSASVGLARDGHTLIIRGDDADNHIAISQDGRRGVAVVADGVASSFTGIDQIIVDTGDGHDVVDVEAVEGLPLIRTLNITTGAGNDRVSVAVGASSRLADPPDPDMPTDQMPVISIETGAGNDVVNVETVEGLPLIRTLNIDAGAGDDRVSVMVRASTVLADPPDPDMPTDQIPVIHIDTGAGNDVVAVEGLPLIRSLNIDTGAGHDRVSVTVGDPTGLADPPDPDMPTDQMPVIRIDTGAGNDVVDVETVEGLPLIRSLNIDTGAGNDRVSVTVGARNVLADPPDPDMPTDQMPVIHIDTGAGNDVIDVRLRRNQVLLDIDDGPGKDLVHVVVSNPTSITGGT